MKKTVAFAAIVTVLSAGSAAFADEPTVAYTGGNVNTATVTGAGDYSVVLIKDSDNNIVYVDQNNSSFDSVVNFLIQDSPDVGTYTAVFGSDSGNPITTTFYVGVQSERSGDVPMTRLSSNLENDGKYSTGFFRIVNAGEYEKYNSLKVGYKNNGNTVWGGFALKDKGFPQTTGEGDLTLIFELNEIEADEIGTVSVFLSSDEVAQNTNAYE